MTSRGRRLPTALISRVREWTKSWSSSNHESDVRAYPAKLLRDFDILARAQGLLGTMESQLPVDGAGAPIPWFTYPAIEYLSQFDFTGKQIFEYGCGNSSRYWVRRGASVWSVEHDEGWYRKVESSADERRTTYLCPERDAYVRAIERAGMAFDAIVIDGVWRTECALASVDHLRSGGFIILDNADRDIDAAAILRRKNFFEVDFSGFGPVNDYTWTTAIFLPPGGTDQSKFHRPRPIGGLSAADQSSDA